MEKLETSQISIEHTLHVIKNYLSYSKANNKAYRDNIQTSTIFCDQHALIIENLKNNQLEIRRLLNGISEDQAIDIRAHATMLESNLIAQQNKLHSMCNSLLVFKACLTTSEVLVVTMETHMIRIEREVFARRIQIRCLHVLQ